MNKRNEVNRRLAEWAANVPQIIAVIDTGKLMPYDGSEYIIFESPLSNCRYGYRKFHSPHGASE